LIESSSLALFRVLLFFELTSTSAQVSHDFLQSFHGLASGIERLVDGADRVYDTAAAVLYLAGNFAKGLAFRFKVFQASLGAHMVAPCPGMGCEYCNQAAYGDCSGNSYEEALEEISRVYPVIGVSPVFLIIAQDHPPVCILLSILSLLFIFDNII
jgi:hypothetical protein